ncbi:MAG: glycerophosphoryl diester phosphodiesterase membrane domain-containing protein [Candidatus Saganbacteria bacterium]|nr:glycerophosphoryl diester phosphodiesterase membrane domain-containing protein [Candidatus Saganbacteria bacterium]
MDISKAFVNSWNTYVKNFIVIILASIVAMLLSILVAPLIGFQMMFVKAKRGSSINFNDIFAPFSCFLPLFLGAIWIGILLALAFIPAVICFYLKWNAIGAILMIAAWIFDIYLGVNWMFALLLVYDKKMKIGEAMKASQAMVSKNNWWMHLVLLILAGIVSGIGGIVPVIGLIFTIFTMPIGTGAIANVYADETK